MTFLILLGILLVLAALPIAYAMTNPVVNVADDLTTTAPYAKVDAELARLLANTRGYEVQVLAAGTYSLSYRRAPAWALVLGLFTFPLGIFVVLLARETLTLTFSAAAQESGTRILVFGRVHEKLARATGTAVQVRLDGLLAATGGEVQPQV